MTPIIGEIIGWEALLVLALIALLFGGAKLPGLARSMGQAHREFRKGLTDDADPESRPDAPTSPPD